MRKLFLSVVIVIMSLSGEAQTLKVMSYNIKYDNPDDKENNWEARKKVLIGLIRYHSPDLIGVQEALIHQIRDIVETLPEYGFTGVGRDDGKEGGEYSAILYKRDKFNLTDHGTFWLSTTPEKPSKGWDAALPRICTWGIFTDENGEQFTYFNTHFDHIGEKARRKSAELIVEQSKTLGKGPVIISGDFNSTPDSPPYAVMSGSYHDSREISNQPPYGPEATFNGFEFDKIPQTRIDHIFVDDHWDVLSYVTITDSYSLHYPSDHFPVMAKLERN